MVTESNYEQLTTQIKPRGARQLTFRRFPFILKPFEVFSKIYKHYDHVYILESFESVRKLAQYSFIGFDPHLTITIRNGEARIRDLVTGQGTIEKNVDPLVTLKKLIQSRAVICRSPRFTGGAVGYISYDTVRYWEKLPEVAANDSNFPDVEFGIFDDGIVFDHRKRQAFYYYSNENRLPEVEKLIKEATEFEHLSYTPPKVNVTKENFENMVIKAKEHITLGDILQVVISKRYDFHIRGDLIDFYKTLRGVNPSPYMYFLKMGGRQIIGSSPEMLVRVDKGTVETYPIAGTRPLVKNPAENRALAEELLLDPKERAEHVMLVDLARNDIGKVSRYGSVQVPEFLKVHQYSHVQHIVSRVVGKLEKNCDSFDVLGATFPAGTVSGAPKVRAMEIIEESEPVRRGPYAGAVGYFSYNGNADFAITIRTLVCNQGRAYIQVGAGIVADSIPEREWYETEHKARALMEALEISGSEKYENPDHRQL